MASARDGERRAASTLDLLLRRGDALLAAGHERHREALAGETPGYRPSQAGTDTENRRHLTVHMLPFPLVCRLAGPLAPRARSLRRPRCRRRRAARRATTSKPTAQHRHVGLRVVVAPAHRGTPALPVFVPSLEIRDGQGREEEPTGPEPAVDLRPAGPGAPRGGRGLWSGGPRRRRRSPGPSPGASCPP